MHASMRCGVYIWEILHYACQLQLPCRAICMIMLQYTHRLQENTRSHPPFVLQRVSLCYCVPEVGLQEAEVDPGVHCEDVQQVVQWTHKVMIAGKVCQHGLGNALALIQLMPLQLLFIGHSACKHSPPRGKEGVQRDE